MGINAICHNQDRLHHQTQDYEERHGVLDIWMSILLATDPADPLNSDDRRVVCPTKLGRNYRRVGFYTTTDFVNHGRDGGSERACILKEYIDIYRDEYDYLSELRTTAGGCAQWLGSEEKCSLEGRLLHYSR